MLCLRSAAQCCIALLCNLHVHVWDLASAWPAGPVDGPVLFNNCSSSQVAVACQQFQAKGCKDIDFGELPCSSMVHAGAVMSACSTLRAAPHGLVLQLYCSSATPVTQDCCRAWECP